MSHLKTHEQYQRMTRGQVAGELRRLAAQLESAHAISYGDGRLQVPEQVEWDLEIDQSADGATLLLALKVIWPAASPASATQTEHRVAGEGVAV